MPQRGALVQRLRRRAVMEGRPDDADEKVIRNRFHVYEGETRPLLASPGREGRLNRLPGLPAAGRQRIASTILAPVAVQVG